MPPGLEPFDIFKHRGFTVRCDVTMKPGFWGIDDKEVVWMAPDVYKRLQALIEERKNREAAKVAASEEDDDRLVSPLAREYD